MEQHKREKYSTQGRERTYFKKLFILVNIGFIIPMKGRITKHKAKGKR